jgi:RNA polymerase sigma-70 factor (ECF subfamily)
MPDLGRLVHAFVQGLPDSAPDDLQRVGDALATAIAGARATWPGIDLDPERFVGFVAARIVPGAPILDGLSRLRTADLWLACACGDRDPAALAAFERAFGSDVDIALATLGAPAHVADEARQVVRARLFVASPGDEPVIARYGGRGDLRAWVRATTVRAAIDLIRRARREVPSEDAGVDEPIPASDPELARLRDRYGVAFKQAFADAFDALSRRDRAILRYRYVDDLDIDGIGAVYRVHRATAARWLQRIRGDLLDDTRARLAAELQVTTGELDSILRFVGSQLDVSIGSALAPR